MLYDNLLFRRKELLAETETKVEGVEKPTVKAYKVFKKHVDARKQPAIA